jgi:hypothetical protein
LPPSHRLNKTDQRWCNFECVKGEGCKSRLPTSKAMFPLERILHPMKRVIPITQQFQHFLQEINENFGATLPSDEAGVAGILELLSWEERDRYLGVKEYARAGKREYQNGFYGRKFVSLMGTLVLRVARMREKSFLPEALKRFERRAPEVMMLIREAFLRGLSTRQVGRIVRSYSFRSP